jgi:hypothetical protein
MRVKLAMAKLAELSGGRKHMIHRHQLTCAQFVDLADAYALGALDELERHACARHIARTILTTAAARRSPRRGRGRSLARGLPGSMAPRRAVASDRGRACARNRLKRRPNGCDWKVSSTSVCRRAAHQHEDRAAS